MPRAQPAAMLVAPVGPCVAADTAGATAVAADTAVALGEAGAVAEAAAEVVASGTSPTEAGIAFQRKDASGSTLCNGQSCKAHSAQVGNRFQPKLPAWQGVPAVPGRNCSTRPTLRWVVVPMPGGDEHTA